MFPRHHWLAMIERGWQRRSVVWMAGVRRAGKTTLAHLLDDVEHFDCELPRVRRALEDPEGFLRRLRGKRICLDEIHRLANPSEVLKIAADHFGDVRVLATGSSTLAATAKFRDTLTGRKAVVWLTPMATQDLSDFGATDLRRRFLRGGLPPFFLATDERDFQDWMDAYWAKDIQELFRLERRHSFLRFAELVFVQSGQIFEATRFARPCEVSRTTIASYLSALEATYVAHVVRPFSSHRPSEIVSAPKVYGFDTGFVCYHSGFGELHDKEMGIMWEHFVLNELHAHLQSRDEIHYWRDKRKHEVDFVLVRRGAAPCAIECKWSANGFEPSSLRALRRQYPEGANLVVAYDVDQTFGRTYGDLDIEFVSLPDLVRRVAPIRS